MSWGKKVTVSETLLDNVLVTYVSSFSLDLLLFSNRCFKPQNLFLLDALDDFHPIILYKNSFIVYFSIVMQLW